MLRFRNRKLYAALFCAASALDLLAYSLAHSFALAAAATAVKAVMDGWFFIYYNMVGVGSNVLLEDGAVKDARLALGAVAIVPKRAFHAEEAILGRQLTPELIEQAARIASQDDCRPISDIRATADYRREMVRLLVRDALKLAAGIKIEGLNDEAEN